MKIINAITTCVMMALGGAEANASAPWVVNPSDYRYDMSLYLEFSFEEGRMDCSRYEVAAFVGDECRGIAETLTLGEGEECLYLRARSNRESGETMTFRYYDRETEEVQPVDDASFEFVSNGRLGYPSEPYAVMITRRYDVTITAGDGGTVDNEGGRFTAGTELTVTATPAEGYRFVQWSDGVTTNPRTIVVDGHLTLAAEFAVNSYTLTLYLNDEPYRRSEVDFGAPVVVEDPEVPEGMEFKGWTDEIPETMPAHDVDIHGSYGVPDSVTAIGVDADTNVTVCDLLGRMVCRSASWTAAAGRLSPGIYIVNGEKRIVRK